MGLRQRFNLKRFFSGEGPEAGPIFLSQRRVFILPSKMGVYFAAMMLVMLLGAVNYNNSLAYLLVFLLASIFFVTILHTYRNLLHLRIDVGHTAAVFCGEKAQVPILLDNRHNAARFAVKLWFGKRRIKNQDRHITMDIAGDQCQQQTLSLPTTERGLHNVPRLTLETSFPLGLFRAWAYAQRDVQYLVYPKADQQHGLPIDLSYQQSLEGDRGHGADDFAGLRNYHSGDSLRHIHWKTVAREQGMYTKQFGGDRASELWLDWESLPELDTEARLSRLTRWVLDASAAQINYGLRLPGTVIPLNTGLAHQHQCLKALAMFNSDEHA
jgi:uncharacterized protein (DUF58 family)